MIIKAIKCSTKTKISELGNSFVIRLNKKLSEFLKAKKGKEVTISPIDKNKLMVSIERNNLNI